jgi:hypothetical protein
LPVLEQRVYATDFSRVFGPGFWPVHCTIRARIVRESR